MKMTPIQQELQKMGSRISVVLLVIGVLLLGLDLWVHRHGETDLEDLLFFPALYGFAAFIMIVIVGIGLRKIVMRGEDYYDD